MLALSQLAKIVLTATVWYVAIFTIYMILAYYFNQDK